MARSAPDTVRPAAVSPRDLRVNALIALLLCTAAGCTERPPVTPSARTVTVHLQLVREETFSEREWIALWGGVDAQGAPRRVPVCVGAVPAAGGGAAGGVAGAGAGGAGAPAAPAPGAGAGPAATPPPPPAEAPASATGSQTPPILVPKDTPLPLRLIDVQAVGTLFNPSQRVMQASLYAPSNVALIATADIAGTCERRVVKEGDKDAVRFAVKPVRPDADLRWDVPVGSTDALNTRVDLSPKVRAHEGARVTDEGVLDVEYRPATKESIAENRLAIALFNRHNQLVMLRPFALAARESPTTGYAAKLKLPDSGTLGLGFFGAQQYTSSCSIAAPASGSSRRVTSRSCRRSRA